VLHDGATVGAGAYVRKSLVGAGARIGRRSVLHGSVIGDGAHVGAHNELRNGTRVWCEAVLPDRTVRFSSLAGEGLTEQ
jgi:mannose-1-phosphate guanylyltransferase